ncbi:MAG TPA: porin family protein [Bacteroidales bacterium]|nr:porin family protein [Bacteroidales bacterium]
MKRIILLLGFAIITAQGFSQISFGPKIGVNLNRLSTDFDQTITDIKNESKTGLQIGAFLRIGGKTYIQPELLYSSRGGKFTGIPKGSTDESEYTYSIDAIDIPILVGSKVLNMPFVKLRVFAGPVASFFLDKEMKIDDIKDEQEVMKDCAWALTLGAGVDVLMFTLDLRYEFGLNNISDVEHQSVKNNLFNITLGWKIL